MDEFLREVLPIVAVILVVCLGTWLMQCCFPADKPLPRYVPKLRPPNPVFVRERRYDLEETEKVLRYLRGPNGIQRTATDLVQLCIMFNCSKGKPITRAKFDRLCGECGWSELCDEIVRYHERMATLWHGEQMLRLDAELNLICDLHDLLAPNPCCPPDCFEWVRKFLLLYRTACMGDADVGDDHVAVLIIKDRFNDLRRDIKKLGPPPRFVSEREHQRSFLPPRYRRPGSV